MNLTTNTHFSSCIVNTNTHMVTGSDLQVRKINYVLRELEHFISSTSWMRWMILLEPSFKQSCWNKGGVFLIGNIGIFFYELCRGTHRYWWDKFHFWNFVPFSSLSPTLVLVIIGCTTIAIVYIYVKCSYTELSYLVLLFVHMDNGQELFLVLSGISFGGLRHPYWMPGI